MNKELLPDIISDIRDKCVPKQIQVGQLQASACLWLASKTGMLIQSSSFFLPFDNIKIDASRIFEVTYLASIGFFLDLNYEFEVIDKENIIKGLEKTYIRRANTPEKNGIADDPLNLIGLFLLSIHLKNNEAIYALKNLLKKITEQENSYDNTLMLGILNGFGIPYSQSKTDISQQNITKAILLYRFNKDIGEKIFPNNNDKELENNLFKLILTGKINRESDFDSMILLVVLELISTTGNISQSSIENREVNQMIKPLDDFLVTLNPNDKLYRLKIVQHKINTHIENKCKKCKASTLSTKDNYDDQKDIVTREWNCSDTSCGYKESAIGIPISEWDEKTRESWYKKAADLRAKQAIIRCPNCAYESIEAEEAGVTILGTSQHVWLSCKTDGCNFTKRKVERSIIGTARSIWRNVILVALIVIFGAIAVWLIKYTPQNPISTSNQFQKNSNP